MKKNLRGTKTLENLMKSFAGESQARMRYTYFASVAGKKDISKFKIFLWKQLRMRRSMQRYS